MHLSSAPGLSTPQKLVGLGVRCAPCVGRRTDAKRAVAALPADRSLVAWLMFLGAQGKPLEVGKGVVRAEGKDVALLAYGSSVNPALAAAEMLRVSERARGTREEQTEVVFEFDGAANGVLTCQGWPVCMAVAGTARGRDGPWQGSPVAGLAPGRARPWQGRPVAGTAREHAIRAAGGNLGFAWACLSVPFCRVAGNNKAVEMCLDTRWSAS
eukprot:17602-Chlamydomonas_euryale.AAC.1